MRVLLKNILVLIFILAALASCGDLFAKQNAIKSVQNYRMGKHAITFKAWLEDRMDSNSAVEKIWNAGRIKKGFWVVQITFKTSFDEQRLLYFVNLETGKIRGADDGFSQATLQEFEKSRPEFI